MADALRQDLFGSQPADIGGIGVDAGGQLVKNTQGTRDAKRVFQAGTLSVFETGHRGARQSGTVGNLSRGQALESAPGSEPSNSITFTSRIDPWSVTW